MGERDNKDRVSQHAVVELHGESIFKEIPPQWRIEEQARWIRQQRPVDQRPGIVDAAGAQPGDQRAEIDLSENKEQKRNRTDANARRHWRRWLILEALCRPQQRHIDQTGEQKMGREPILRDFDALGETGRDHPPADRALQRTQAEDQP